MSRHQHRCLTHTQYRTRIADGGDCQYATREPGQRFASCLPCGRQIRLWGADQHISAQPPPKIGADGIDDHVSIADLTRTTRPARLRHPAREHLDTDVRIAVCTTADRPGGRGVQALWRNTRHDRIPHDSRIGCGNGTGATRTGRSGSLSSSSRYIVCRRIRPVCCGYAVISSRIGV